MWKYVTKETSNDYILSLNLIDSKISDSQKIKYLYNFSNHASDYYYKFDIPKKSGGNRTIIAPDYFLKSIQKNIFKNVLSDITISKYAKAYCKGSSIRQNAIIHQKQRKILKLDIKDIFNNININMVKKFVFKTIYFPLSVKNLLASICCYDNYLPQGAPTSPYISNIIMFNFDEYIGTWCEENNINYTRYCDDLTFSGDFNHYILIKKVKSYLNFIGFELNDKKTKVVKKNSRQLVTGVVVNEKIQVNCTYRDKLRQELYYCQHFGVEDHLKRIGYNNEPNHYKKVILGKINYILSINPNDKYFINIKNNIDSYIKFSN